MAAAWDEALLRTLTPQVLGVLVRRGADFATAEDAVQDALLEAVRTWDADPPRDPKAWLVTVAWRRFLDATRSEVARRRREESVGEEPDAPPVAGADDTLLLYFLCAHPSLTPSSAVALTLRAVGGLTTRQVAQAYLVPEATMAQRISRAKRTVSDVRLDQPGDVATVLRTLYLVFNEGYSGDVDLAAEAIRLTRQVAAAVDHPDVQGLLALMLLHHARRPARTGPDGRLVPLAEQDRDLWDTVAIAEGVAVLQAALARDRLGEYQAQAAIAALHADAPTAAETDWVQVVEWYDELVRLTGSPVARLNRAVAVGEADGPRAGLAALGELDPALPRHTAVAAYLHERDGARATAARLYAEAAHRAPHLAERDHLVRQAARLHAQLRQDPPSYGGECLGAVRPLTTAMTLTAKNTVSEPDLPAPRTALVVGATGIVGQAVARRLVEEGCETYGLSRSGTTAHPDVRPVQADLGDPDGLAAALAGRTFDLVAITAWTRMDTEAENIRVNGGAVRNLLAALSPGGEVRHVALMTGLKHYLGPFEAYGKGEVPDTPFREEEERLPYPNFYYAQEDELLAAAGRDGFTWSVHRSHTVFGHATGNAMNMVATLCAYAALCRDQGLPFVFPGSETQWNSVTDVTDADLLAEQMTWAARTPAGQDQAFNTANGDVFRWRWLWPQVADWFGLEWEGWAEAPRPLEVAMEGMEAAWTDLAERHDLVEPDLARVASWWHTDADLGRDVEVVTDMNKSRAAGFTATRDTRASFFDHAQQYRDARVIP